MGDGFFGQDMSLNRLIAVGLLLVSAGACATPTVAPEDFVAGSHAEPPSVKEASAQLVIIASERMSRPNWIQIASGQIGPLRTGAWLLADVDPGKVEIRSSVGHSLNSLTVDCAEGARVWLLVGDDGGRDINQILDVHGRSVLQDVSQVQLLDAARTAEVESGFGGASAFAFAGNVVKGIWLAIGYFFALVTVSGAGAGA